MKNLTKAMIALTAGTLFSVGAQASIVNNLYAAQPYVGAKIGQMDLDIDNVSTGSATAYGVYAGMNFDQNFGAEIEFVSSEDVNANRTQNGANLTGDASAKTYGAYGTYRYVLPNTAFYGKGKIGVARTEVSSQGGMTNNNFNTDSRNTGLAGGLGIGYAFNPNFGIEAEYAMVGGDVDNLTTIGAHLKF